MGEISRLQMGCPYPFLGWMITGFRTPIPATPSRDRLIRTDVNLYQLFKLQQFLLLCGTSRWANAIRPYINPKFLYLIAEKTAVSLQMFLSSRKIRVGNV
jgi:hypothetical protein